ncbi:hypothetical protein [Citrobacter arsenatis]|uniref:hypothetical protein n=1 Tax=Citrobacter arsenatis TaxID=2546350 RepID=UPI00300DF8B7
MEIKDIRQQRLKEWFADKKLPPKDASFISQVIGGKFIGERAARRLENDHGMPAFYLDTPFGEEVSSAENQTGGSKSVMISGSDLRLKKAIELLDTLPDDEAELLLNEFLMKVESRVAYYDEKFREYVEKNKLNKF